MTTSISASNRRSCASCWSAVAMSSKVAGSVRMNHDHRISAWSRRWHAKPEVDLRTLLEASHSFLFRPFIRVDRRPRSAGSRSEEHTSELQSLMRISYAVFCLKKKTPTHTQQIQIGVAHSRVNKTQCARDSSHN